MNKMSVLSWKKVNLCILTKYYNNKLNVFKNNITTFCFNNTFKIFCDSKGIVYTFSENMECVSFQVQIVPITFSAVTSENIFIILSQNEDNQIFVQIYNMNELTKRGGPPRIALARLYTRCKVTVLEATSRKNKALILAIGLEDGQIFWHHAPVCRDLTPRFRYISIGMRYIIGIYVELQELKDKCYVFVNSIDGIFRMELNDDSIVDNSKIILDSKKTRPSFCFIKYSYGINGRYFVVARNDAIYCFTSDGRGPCYAIEGEKKHILWTKNNLIIVMQPQINKLQQKTTSTLLVVDIESKIILLNKKLEGEVNCVFECHGNIMILKKTRKMLLLQERDVFSKIQLLLRKHMYDNAFRILDVKRNEYDQHLAYINFYYGNFLLSKGEPIDAISKYIKTIGWIKPYNVIQKIINLKSNYFLIEYLKVVVDSDSCTKDLERLLNCCNNRVSLEQKFEISSELGHLFNKNFEEEKYSVLFDKYRIMVLEKPEEIFQEIMKILEKKKFLISERVISLFASNESLCTKLLKTIIDNTPNCHHNFYNYFLLVYLKIWKKKAISSGKLIQFMKNFKKQLDLNHAMIICKMYMFSNGLKYLYSETQNNRENDYLSYIQTLKNNTQRSHIISKAESFSILFQKNPNYVLQFLKNASFKSKEAKSHIKIIFRDDAQWESQNNEETNAIRALEKSIHAIKSQLHKLKYNAIEFRNIVCNICRQEMKLPFCFHICQHSFHRDCIASYATKNFCIICKENKTVQLQLKSNLQHNIVTSNLSKLLEK